MTNGNSPNDNTNGDTNKEVTYLVGSKQLRAIAAISGVVATIVIVAILVLISSLDQASYVQVDTTQYDRTIEEAVETLEGYEAVEGETGRATIPIDRAIELMAQRGLNEIQVAISSAPPQVAEETETEEEATLSAGEPVVEPILVGEQAYLSNCASCHQPTGQGITGAFPTLVQQSALLYRADRDYLANLLLYGLQGEIDVLGNTYNGVMPAWQQLSDEQIADILNYITTNWDNNRYIPEDFTPYAASDIAPLRGQGLTSADMYEIRQNLDLSAAAQADAPTEDVAEEAPAEEEVAEEEVVEEDVTEEAPAEEDVAEETAEEEVAEETTEETVAQAPAEEETTEEAAEETTEAATVSFEWQELGENVYNSNCISCHQANGQGITGAFPPLVGHMADLYNAEGGETYLINLQLYGLQGQIEVEGQSYNGVMPAWQQLSDEQIAAVLNYTLTTWGNEAELNDFTPYVPGDIEPQRGLGLSSQDMNDQRSELNLE